MTDLLFETRRAERAAELASIELGDSKKTAATRACFIAMSMREPRNIHLHQWASFYPSMMMPSGSMRGVREYVPVTE